MSKRMQHNARDYDIQKALDWFLSLIPKDEWHQRRKSIELYLDTIHNPPTGKYLGHTPEPVSIEDDRMGWYLYLAETALRDVRQYEPTQGARVLPIFKRLGGDIDSLGRIGGIRHRALRLMPSERRQADSGLLKC